MSVSQATSHTPESVLDEHGLASVTLVINWSDGRATHEDQLHVESFSAWREIDLLPSRIASSLCGMQSGDEVDDKLPAGEWVGPWENAGSIVTQESRFDRHIRRGMEVQPQRGRFYPQSFLHGVDGILKESTAPFRITDLSDGRLVADLNHPLARFDLSVTLRLDEVLPGYDRRGGRCQSSLDDLLQYPGLAATQANGPDTHYGDNGEGLARPDNGADTAFYAMSRMVQHLDYRALETVNDLYHQLIPAQADVLDLMASFDSHLQGVQIGKLHVLGMNEEELAANTMASDCVVRDLNIHPALPFHDASLDAIVCTASIEYLTHPREVLQEALRVLRPGGVMTIIFSNRWFPSKAINVWGELHEFERVGMVTQWLHHAGFKDLHTVSSRGWPRPTDDRHASKTAVSDPVYGAWGFKPLTCADEDTSGSTPR